MSALLDVVVPVHYEEGALEESVRRLRGYLDDEFPFSAVVTIADNASTDGTRRIAGALARELPGVRLLHLDEKGRGRALRAAWSQSAAAVVAYMDVDETYGACGESPSNSPPADRGSQAPTRWTKVCPPVHGRLPPLCPRRHPLDDRLGGVVPIASSTTRPDCRRHCRPVDLGVRQRRRPSAARAPVGNAGISRARARRCR